MFIERMLGSNAKIKILRVLAEVRTAYNLKALQQETSLSSGILSISLKDLVDERILVKIKGNRKERLYKFNTDSPYATAVLELFKTEKTRQRKDVIMLDVWHALAKVFNKNKNKIDLMLLFGSHARGEATLDSDIDILFILKKGVDEKKVKNKIKKIDKRVQPLILSMDNFMSNVKNNTPLTQNLKKDGILIFASEELNKDKKTIEELLGIFIEGSAINAMEF